MKSFQQQQQKKITSSYFDFDQRNENIVQKNKTSFIKLSYWGGRQVEIFYCEKTNHTSVWIPLRNYECHIGILFSNTFLKNIYKL
jgi:hypothetical protein